MTYVFLDFETYYTTAYSLKRIPMEEYVRSPKFETIGVAVQVDSAAPMWFPGGEVEQCMELLRDIDDLTVVAHNAPFDALILSHHYEVFPKHVMDTISMARPLFGQHMSMPLANLVKHLGLGTKGTEVVDARGKHLVDFTPDELAAYGEYCKKDVQLCYKLYKTLKGKLPPLEYDIMDVTARMFSDPRLILDKDMLQEHYASEVQRKQDLLDALGGDHIKPHLMSNPKLAELLRKLGVEPPMKQSPTTGAPTYAFASNDAGFKELLAHKDPLVRRVVDTRLKIKSTIEETRAKRLMKISERGPWPIELNYYGAHTGRYSGGGKVNPQNMPRGGKIRAAVRAPDGYMIVAGDLSQIEARMLCYIAEQNDVLDQFRNNEDVYSLFASDIYGREINKSNDPVERFVGKTSILGLGYGVGHVKFHNTLVTGGQGMVVDISMGEARRVVRLYRDKHTRITALWRTCDNALRQMAMGGQGSIGDLITYDGLTIRMPTGLDLHFPHLHMDDDGDFVFARGERVVQKYERARGDAARAEVVRKSFSKIYGAKLVENLMQALTRTITMSSLVSVSKHYKAVLQVHDENIFVVPESEADAACALVEREMTIPPTWAPDLPVACEVARGKTYADAK